MMWVEARKQERKIRGMIVDFRKRAERRKDFYEKFTQDPSQFLQLHGRPCKMHLQPLSNAGSAGEHGPGMMPWPGDSSVIIDRFDGRAHLDFIAEKRSKEDDNYDHDLSSTALAHVNYERYRILVQNDFLNLPEDKYLQQIYMEEKFGPVMKTGEEEKKKQLSDKKAAIPYTYEDSTTPAATAKEDEDEEDADSDVDLDLSINVVELNRDQCTEMNDFAHKYSIKGNDFVSFMYDDHHEQEALRKAKQEEEEKQALSGKKGRRERRQFREKRMLALARKYSPPSYATRNSPTYDPYEKPKDGRSKKKSKSASRSPSPKMTKVTYITSFGGESDSDDNAVKGGPKGIFIPITARRHSSGDRAPPASSLGASVLAAVADVRRGRRSRSGSRKRGRDSRGRRNSRTRGSRSRSRRRKFTEKKRKSRSSSREKKRRSSSSSREKKRRSRSSSREKKRRGRRSASSSSRSRSRSRSKSTARKISREKKPAVTATVNVGQVPKLPSPPRRRYYGRRAHASSDASDSSDESSSERGRTDDGKPAVARIPLGAVASLLASSSTSKDGKTTSPGRSSGQTGGAKSRGSDDTRIHASATSGGSTKTSAGGKLTPQERLKRKMQALINRQYKADKLAELEKREKKLQEEADREDEMRDLTIKYRRKERERRNRDREDMGLPPLLSDDTDDEEYADRFLADMGPDKDAKDVREYFRRRSRSRSRSGSRSSTKRRSTTASKWTKSSVKRRARSTSSSSSSSSSSQSSLFTRRSRRSRSKSRSRSTSNKRRRRDARRPRSSSSSGSERRNRKRRNNNQNDGKRKKSPSPGPKTTSSAKRQSNTSVYFDEKNYGYGQDEPSSWNEPPPPGDHWGGGHPPPPPPPGWNHNDSWNNDWHGPHPPPYPPPMHHPPPSYPPPPPPPHMPPPSGNWSDKGIERGNRRFTTPPPGLEDEGSDGSSSDTGNTRLVNY